MLRARLANAGAPGTVLIVDLTNPDVDGAGIVLSLREEDLLEGVRTLGFYSHVESATRERAEQVGFDQVVPRSRMARESAELVTRLVATT